jgi:UDP-3-O-[3-hydroxymyristoyl] glucosamine N-acyltransferase
MSEPVFFTRGQGLSIADVVALTGVRTMSAPATDRRIVDIAAIERAGPAEITFAENRDQDVLRVSQAGACFVSPDMAVAVPSRVVPLIVDDPYRAFVQVATALYPDAERPSSLFEVQGAAPGAFVHAKARVEAGVTIDPGAMVGPRAEIGAGTVVGPMAVIGPGVRIGRNCSIAASVSLTNALVGDGVVIEPGCRIGLATGRPLAGLGIVRPQVGRVILQDKVMVGGNSTIDRGSARDTAIGEGTAIDSLVHIPADAVIGRYCRILAGNGSPTAGDGDIDVWADGLEYFASQISPFDPSQPKGTM